MATYCITVELSDLSVDILQARIASGEFHTESDVVEWALLSLGLPAGEEIDPAKLPDSLVEEVRASYEEDLAHPEWALTSEQADAYLARSRSMPAALRKAS